MSRKLSFLFPIVFICFLLVFSRMSFAALADTPEKPDISSQSAAVIDLDSGRILYAEDADQKLEAAGLSKLVTVYLAVNRLPLTDSLTVTAEDLSKVPDEATTIGLMNGDKLTVEDAVYAILLGSSTEASITIARAVSGSEEAFVEEMNSFAAALSCSNTVFKNSYGLSAEGQSITASDMAIIAAEIYRDDTMRKILSTESYSLSDSLTFWNTNRMIYAWDDLYYAACTGGKNGYIVGFGGNFVCYAEKDGKRLAAVVLGADQAEYYYEDARSLLEYAFSNFSSVYPLNGFTLDEIPQEGIVLDNYFETISHPLPAYVFPTSVSFLLPVGTSADDVEKRVTLYDRPKDSVAGCISCYYKGDHLGDIPVYLNTDNIATLRFRLPDSTRTQASLQYGKGSASQLAASPGDAPGSNTGNGSDSTNGKGSGSPGGDPTSDASESAISGKDSKAGNDADSLKKEKKSRKGMIKMIILLSVLLLVLGGLFWLIYRLMNVKKERKLLQEKNRKWMEDRKRELSLEEEEDDEA